jgi:hypothetical protein
MRDCLYPVWIGNPPRAHRLRAAIHSAPSGGGSVSGRSRIGIRRREFPRRADRDYLVIIGHVDPLDCDFDVEHSGLKGHREVVIEHRVEPGHMLGLSMGVGDGFFDHSIELRV